jgi:hypothetical protein
MQYSYVDNERKSSLLAFILIFSVVFGAGFGVLCLTQNNDVKNEAAHPLVQQGQSMTNS